MIWLIAAYTVVVVAVVAYAASLKPKRKALLEEIAELQRRQR
jgi:CcmD family protein